MNDPARHINYRSSPRLHGFTLVEVIAVIVILGIFAGLIVPRLFDDGSRSAESEARAVERLLTAAAERAWAGGAGGPVLALELISADRRLDRPARLRLVAAEENGQWVEDRLTPSVDLTSTQIATAWVDGAALPPSAVGWRVAISGSGLRAPALRLDLGVQRGTTEATAWSILLEPDAAAAELTRAGVRGGNGRPASALDGRIIDLDRAGRGDKPW